MEHLGPAAWSASPVSRRAATASTSTPGCSTGRWSSSNQAIVGSVNANRRHYEAAAAALARADHAWLEKVVSRARAPRQFAEALARQPDDVKVVIEIDQ